MMFCDPFVNKPVCPGLVCPPPEKTHVQQHFKDECDIHVILRRIECGGDPSVLQARKGFYADLVDLPIDSLQDAFDAVDTAEAAFASLPSDVRSKFNNDSYEFISYIQENGIESVSALFGDSTAKAAAKADDATTRNDDATKAAGATE